MRFNLLALASLSSLAAASSPPSASLDQRIQTLKALSKFNDGVASNMDAENFDQYAQYLVASAKKVISAVSFHGPNEKRGDKQGSSAWPPINMEPDVLGLSSLGLKLKRDNTPEMPADLSSLFANLLNPRQLLASKGSNTPSSSAGLSSLLSGVLNTREAPDSTGDATAGLSGLTSLLSGLLNTRNAPEAEGDDASAASAGLTSMLSGILKARSAPESEGDDASAASAGLTSLLSGILKARSAPESEGDDASAASAGLTSLLSGILNTRQAPGADETFDAILNKLLDTGRQVLPTNDGVVKRDALKKLLDERDPQTDLLKMLPKIPALGGIGLKDKMVKRQESTASSDFASNAEMLANALYDLNPDAAATFFDKINGPLSNGKRSIDASSSSGTDGTQPSTSNAGLGQGEALLSSLLKGLLSSRSASPQSPAGTEGAAGAASQPPLNSLPLPLSDITSVAQELTTSFEGIVPSDGIQGGPGFGPSNGLQDGNGPKFGPSNGVQGGDGPGFGPNNGIQGGNGPNFGPSSGPQDGNGPGFGPSNGFQRRDGPNFGPSNGVQDGDGPNFGPNSGIQDGNGPNFGPSNGFQRRDGPNFGPSNGVQGGGGPNFGPNNGVQGEDGPNFGPNNGVQGEGGPSFGPNNGFQGGPSFGPNNGLQDGPSFGPNTGLQEGPSFGPNTGAQEGPSFGPNTDAQEGQDPDLAERAPQLDLLADEVNSLGFLKADSDKGLHISGEN